MTESPVTPSAEVPATGSDPSPDPDPRVMPSRDEWWSLLTGRPGAAALGGLATGLVIGGVGGRLAMLLLRLTSDDSVRGIRSDDGFVIGRFTTETIGLLILGALAGAGLAILYLVVRRWLPAGFRPLQAALFFGAVGGAAIIAPDGVDFTFLEPSWLAVGLFIALPAAYGAAMAGTVEWLIRHPDEWRRWRIAALVPLVVLSVPGPFLPIAVPSVVAVLAARRWPDLVDWSTALVPTWGVRALLFMGFALGASTLVSDVTDIL